MSREVVLVSEDPSFEEDSKAAIKQEVDVNKRDVVLKSESDDKTAGENEAVQTKSENSNETEGGNPITFADDEEDVPSDFFDDFSNQDFMAGLDIVDAWDEEELMVDKEKAKKVNDSRDLRQKTKRKRAERDRGRRRYSRSPIRRRRSRDRSRSKGRPRGSRDRDRSRSKDRPRGSRDRDWSRSKDRPRGSRDRDRRHRSKDVKSKDKPKDSKDLKEGDEQTPDHRRDPEKTKRDIQKDKDKCAKNNEARIISEKLKVVETGLVPPGTEMEVDLKQLKAVMPIKEPDKKPASVREEKGNVREEKIPEREEKGSMREEKQPYERRRRSRSISNEARYQIKGKRYSPLRRSPRSSDRNYEHRPRLRSRSPYRGRSRSRSPYYRDRERRKMSSERRIYLEERKRFNRYRNTSPIILRRKSRDRSPNLSPISNISEREMWLRQRERDKRHRKMACSPNSDSEFMNRKRSNDFLEDLANKLKADRKKISFLKEIQERLNEPSQLEPNYSMASAPGPVPPPIPGVNSAAGLPGRVHDLHPIPRPGFIPGPPSHPFFPQSDLAPQYDQQFFIGQPMFGNPNPYAPSFMGPGPVPTLAGPIPTVPSLSDSVMVSRPVNSPLQTHPNFNGNQNNVDLLKVQKAAEAQKEKDQEAIAKLFEDKKISLSDFLSVSAKHADPSKPVNVQKKIKVISLCQDAIKALGGDSKLSGRFFLKKKFKEPEKKEDSKFPSPLRKIPVVRFSFTTPSRGGDDKSMLQNATNKLLASLGLVEASRSITPKPAASPVSSEASVRSIPPKKIVPVKTPPSRKYDPILGAKFQMKMCQTEAVKCNICEIRKARKFVDKGSQCATRTVDSGTQITDEDLQRLGIRVPVKDALRNQSFAHLTPAQILAAQIGGHEESPKKDSIFPAVRMMTPPPPDISPEKHNIRVNLSNNDSFPNRSEYLDRYKPDHFNSSSNNANRSGGFKPPSIFDKMMPTPFENINRSHSSFDSGSKPNSFENVRPNFDNRGHMQQTPQHNDNRGHMQQTPQHNDNRFRGNNQGFNQRMVDDEIDYEEPPTNYGGNTNQRSFLANKRSNFLSGPYGGRKFF